MISLVDFIAESCSYENTSKINGTYERKVDKEINFTDADGQKYFDALKKEFEGQYKLDIKGGRSIFFYKPKGQMTMKNLVCYVSCNYYIDFGPNKDLVNTLGPKIMQVIDSVK